ncbi:MAG: hypothetical protein R6U17_03630, partial [Thermoplasmata archaeon]
MSGKYLKARQLAKEMEKIAKETAEEKKAALDNLEKAENLLDYLREMGGDVDEAGKFIEKARRQLEEKKLDKSNQTIEKGMEIIRKALGGRINELIQETEELHELISEEERYKESQEKLERAKELMEDDEFKDSLECAKEALNSASLEIQETLTDEFAALESMVISLDDKEKEVENIESMIHEARDTMEKDDFSTAMSLVNKCKSILHEELKRWVKREGKPSDEAVLAARMVDRSIRPLFPKDFKNETQVVLTLLSVDHENDPDVLGALGASAALHISDIPWDGPVAVMRMGYRDGNYFVNPTNGERENSDLDLLVTVGKKGVVMLEGGADQLPKEEFYQAVEAAKEEGDKILQVLEELREEVGKSKMDFEKLPKKEI